MKSSLIITPFLFLAVAAVAAPAPTPAGASDLTIIAASDSRFHFDGRFDRADPAEPVIIWAGSRVSLDFEGPRLALLWGRAEGQNYFNVRLDDFSEVVAVPAGESGRFVWPHALAPGRHHLTLFKRSEAASGAVRFRGVELAAGSAAFAPAPRPAGPRFEFIGDSITVGACNEDGAADQWEDRRTHNHALSYATLTSAAFGADHQAMAVSGMGIITGWVPVKAGEAWDRTYPRADSPRADLASWIPDVVFINLGENDDSFTHAHNQPFPENFTAGYVALVKAVRTAWPAAHIVLLRGGMFGGAQSQPLRAAWTAAAQQLEAADPQVSHFVFAHWSSNHPRVADDRAMADELVAWLKQQPFLARGEAR